ncbi:MAG: radical SAM protein [Elusimicrobia bacterium]|nr:radical SAM protein [Elusimicrobiota bacterium]
MSETFLPKRAIIELPYICNLKCQNCGLWKKDYRKLRAEEKDLLTPAEIEKIQKELKEYGIKRISYIGGEPFLNKDILDLAKSAKKCGLETAAVTNGTALSDKDIEKIVSQELFNTIVFSLDGPENIHDYIRGKKGTFWALRENILLFRKLKNLNKKKLPKIYIYCTLSKLNYKYAEQVWKNALSFNANLLRFQSASSLNSEILKKASEILGFEAGDIHSYFNSNSLNRAQIEKISKTIRKIKSSKFTMKVETEPILEGKKNAVCSFIGQDLVITPSGKVLLCPMAVGWIAGDIRKEGIKDILNRTQEKAKKIKEEAQKGKLPICYQCCVSKINI